MLLIRGLQRNCVLLAQVKANIRSLSSMHASNTQNDENIKAKYDIIVAGGGMVGCTLACALGTYKLDYFFRNIQYLLSPSSDIIVECF